MTNIPLDPENFFSESKSTGAKKKFIEDSILFGTAASLYQDNEGDSFLGSSFSRKRAWAYFGILFLMFASILYRLFTLQIFGGESYFVRAENNRQRIIPIPSERGLIFDRNQVQLTKNVPNFSLTLRPQDLPSRYAGPDSEQQKERERIIKKIGEITGKTEEDVIELLNEYGSYSYDSIVLKEDLDYDTALGILIDGKDLPGLDIQYSSKRLYIQDLSDVITNEVDEFAYDVESVSSSVSTGGESGNLASISHIIGYLGKLTREELDILYREGYLPSDTLGKTGIEKTYESFLRGTYGRRRIEVNALGKKQYTIAEEPPIAGDHIILSIDTKMQAALQGALERGLKEHGRTRGVAIALDPNTGEVLAMVSWPSFDNNDFAGGIDHLTYKNYLENENRPLFNRAIGGTYPSGSTIKPAIAAIALYEKVITPNTTFLSNGGLAVGQWFFPDWLDGGHGRTNVRKSIADSVNTFYYYIGGGYEDFPGLGVNSIVRYLKRFGLSDKLGIDIPGEASGFLPSKEWKAEVKGESWYVGDTYNLSIGQGDLLITPLQLSAVTASIANFGTLYKPHLVKEIQNAATGEKRKIEPEEIRNEILDYDSFYTVRWGMRDCVTEGSCRALKSLSVPIAGKTGTAQWNRNKDDHAWFTSFAPFDNPEIVVSVLLEEGVGGSVAAVPVAKDFYEWWIRNRGE